uniref:Zinc finger homeobox protein 4-like n=1 Tax=Oncorhynchus tshawytscha TaxID=74940 RepID=A0AAZ3R025_ONCTS
MQEKSGETVSSESNEVWLCPLCQQGLPDRGSLSLHLSDSHSVLPNCVDKLLDIAAPKQGASGLELLEASSASLSDPCHNNENTDGPQHNSDSRHTLVGSGDKDKEMDKEAEEARDLEGGGVQERDQSTETPDNNEESRGTNCVMAEGDDSPPFKCNTCLEAFPTRTALSVHYNSASHVQRMRTGSLKQGGENGTPAAPSVPFLSRPYLSNKPYQCTVCRVSYNHAITLESHLKSVLHQTRSRNAGISANSAGGNSGRTNMATNLVVTSGGSAAQLVSTPSSNCVTPASLAAAAMTNKDGDAIQTQPSPSLLSSPVTSAQAVSAFLTLLTSSPSSISHSLLPSLLPSLFAAGASPATASPQLITQTQMLIPFILNGLQTQSQRLNPELLTQSIPLLGLNAAQQAILAQRLSSLQNQWPAVGLQAISQACSEDSQTNKSKVKQDTNEATAEEKGSLKAEEEDSWSMECGDGEREICEEDGKGYKVGDNDKFGTSPYASVCSPESSPSKCTLNSPDSTRRHAHFRARHFSGPPILSEFQIQVMRAFLESRSEADAASPPREDCESLGREVGLTEVEVRKWLTDARRAKERQIAGGTERVSSIAGYGKKYKGLDNDEEEGCLTIDETEGGVSDEASGSHAMDLSNSGGRKEMGRESQGDSCLTSDNEEFYTSVIVSDEDSLSGSMREGPGSPAKEEALVELSADKGSGGKVLRSTTVFLSDAEDDDDAEEAAAQRAKRRKRKRELEREEVEVKKERLDPDVDLQLEAQADPPSHLPVTIDHQRLPSGILHSLPLSLSLTPFSNQFHSPYVLSLPPSVVGLGVAEGDGGKVPAFPNPPNITRFSDPLITSSLSSHTHTSHYMSNGGDCEAALDLSIGKSNSSTSLTGDKTSAQKGRLLDGLGLRPTAFGAPGEGRLIVVKVKPEQATSNSSGFVSGNNMAKASTVYMREKEERDQKGRPKARRYRDMRRSRTIIQAEQLNVLYGCYFKDPNPGKHEFEQISEWVHLPKKVVQIWFQNMRARERKGEVRFISDGTLAAVGKPLIKFTWPLSQPIFSSTPKSNSNSSVSTVANPVRAIPKMEVKKEENVKKTVPNRPKEVASSVSSVSHSVSAVPKTKMELTNNVTMVKIAPKSIAPALPVVHKETRPPPPRPLPKHAPEEEVGEDDEEVDDRNQAKPLARPGSTNRMVPKLPSTPINKSPAATSQKQNGLNYWSAKGPFKINTLSREQLGLSAPRTFTAVGAAAAPTTSPSESSFLHHSTTRRPRTHLSCLQLSILQSCYETCAHPNAMECEAVGTELGLPLKVVQIWFQNTRAKEKRWRLQQEKLSPVSSDPSKTIDMSSGSYLQYNALRAHRPILPKPVQLTVLEPSSPPAGGQPAGRETLRGKCQACNTGFESRAAARSHVFSLRHLATLRTTNFGQPATIINNKSDSGSISVSASGSCVEDPSASPPLPSSTS